MAKRAGDRRRVRSSRDPGHTRVWQRVEVSVLGELVVLVDGAPLTLKGAKRRGLVARLAVAANRPVQEGALLADIWPEREGAGAGSLRTYVSELRQALGPERIVRGTSAYGLALASEELDATCFERLLVASRRPSLTDEERSQMLGRALGLWRGPAMAEFGEWTWAVGCIQHFAELRLQALVARNEARLALGQHAALIAELESHVADQPENEALWGQLTVALYRAGRQARALQTCRRARDGLLAAHGLDAGPELVALEQRVLDQDPSLAAPRTSLTDVPPPRGADAPLRPSRSCRCWMPQEMPNLVGRHAELAELETGVGEAGRNGGLMLVTGEPGIGKSRILSEVAGRLADDEHRLTVFGGCPEFPAGAYAPFAEIVLHLDRHTPGGLVIDAPEVNATLRALIPSLGGGGGETGPNAGTASVVEQTDPDTRRYRLFDALRSALRLAAAGRSLLIVLDDLQWADTSTVLGLRHLLDHPPSVPTVVLGALRDTEEIPLSLRHLLANLQGEGRMVRRPLSGLSVEDLRVLLGRLGPKAGALADPTLAERLRNDTGGNPLFVGQVISQFEDTDADRSASDGDRPAPDPDLALHGDGTRLEIGESLAATVAGRLARLSSEDLSLLRAGAALGLTFDGALAADVAGLDHRAAADSIGALLDRRIIVGLDHAIDHFRFEHALVRQAVYDALRPHRRLRLHAQISDALERRQADGVPGLATQLAHHTVLAGALDRWPQAVRHLRAAGDDAAGIGADEVAAAYYGRALVLTDEHPRSASPTDACELTLLVAEAEHRAGNRTTAKAVVADAARRARRLGRADLLARAALDHAGPLQAAADIEDPAGVELLEEALSAVGDADSPLSALLVGRLAQQTYWTRPRSERAELADKAVAMARAGGDSAVVVTVLANRFWALVGPEDAPSRRKAASEMEALAADLEDIDLAMLAGKCHLSALLESGDFHAADHCAARLSRLAADSHQPEYLRLALNYDGMRAGSRGRWNEAERAARDARRLLVDRGQRAQAEAIYLLQRMPWRWFRGDLAEDLDVLRNLPKLDPKRPAWWALLAWVAADLGEHDEARAALAGLDLATFVHEERAVDWWSVAFATCQVAVTLGDVELGALVYDHLLPYQGRLSLIGQITFLGAVDHHLGVLASLLGDDAAAIGHLVAAVDRHVELGTGPFECLSRNVLGAVLARSHAADQRLEALGHLHRAEQLAERFGVALTLTPD